MRHTKGFAYKILLGILCIAMLAASPDDAFARGKKKSKKVAVTPDRYAAIVIDAGTGKVLFSDNADAPRYPASLTKMMTLYLTFEALKQGRLSLSQMLPVTLNAAQQPQTNISLQPGDRIAVEDIIEALVVRSANDAAVVMAEALGGTEWNFALMMNKKARELGMYSSSFRNPSGLPNPQQKTTARDLATLSIALYRDFPEYVRYFKTQRFTFRGRTYETHNRVTRDYDGADGIKTGYINASGFNLATSVRRDGHHLIGVVMGGKTAQSRDNHMKSLLDRQFALLDTGASATQFAANAPLPRSKPTKVQTGVSITPEVMAYGSAAKDTLRPTETTYQPARTTFAAAQAHAARTGAPWGIQVGVFQQENDAMMAAAYAMGLAGDELQNSEIYVRGEGNVRSIHRARLINLSEQQARNACRKLSSANQDCFVFKRVVEN